MQLERAKQYLNDVRIKFADNPILLKIYEPSALEMVRIIEEEVEKRKGCK